MKFRAGIEFEVDEPSLAIVIPELRREGLTEKQIADSFEIGTTEFRAAVSAARKFAAEDPSLKSAVVISTALEFQAAVMNRFAGTAFHISSVTVTQEEEPET
jgi:hypothetical protein